MPQFLRDYQALATPLKRYLLAQVVFVAPLQCERRLQKRIEGALAYHLRSQSDAASLLPQDIRYIVRRAEEPCRSVTILTNAAVEGLPAQMDA